MLKKYKFNGEIEFAPVYFNSVTKTVINHRFKLENSFQEVLYLIDVWINEGFGWIVEAVESQYINISTYRPLSGSSYISLPVELRNPRKELINIKNKDQKYFYSAMLGILILQKNIQKELEKLIKNLLSILLIKKKLQKKIKSLLVILIMIELRKFKDSMILLLLIDDDESHYVSSKILTNLCFTKQEIKTKNGSVKVVYSVLVAKMC